MHLKNSFFCMCLRNLWEKNPNSISMRRSREWESEIDWWSHTLPPLKEMQWMEAQQEFWKPWSSRHQAEGGDLKHEGEWKKVPAQGCRRISSQPLLPSQVPLCSRYEALEHEGQADDTGEEGLSGGLSGTGQSARWITTSSVKKERRVVVWGHSLLRGTGGPICHPAGKSVASVGCG